ncbi:beta-glucanase [Streptomyces sp. NPDC002589]|uniref:glycoside hydrolase family 16 protein n=1 Tax=Streptomyces sp. NPDC002589 TaxID=3154420 RepID=UPI00331EF359
MPRIRTSVVCGVALVAAMCAAGATPAAVEQPRARRHPTTVRSVSQRDGSLCKTDQQAVAAGIGGVHPTGPAARKAPSPTAGKSLVFDEEFTGPITFGSRWNGSTTSAYKYGNHNPGDDKLDWLTPSAITASGGTVTFTAKPGSNILENGKRSWDTGLLTTEGTTENFQARTGDYAEVRVQLPGAQGAWPAMWTWIDGDDEVDVFEYHPDKNELEVVNHVNYAYTFYTDPATIFPGAWIAVGAHYGATNDDWYLNGDLIYSDHTGVGSTWQANIVLNLSINAGFYHPAPSSNTPITFNANYVCVWR